MRGILFLALAAAFVALFIYPGYLFHLKPNDETPVSPVVVEHSEPPLPSAPPDPAPAPVEEGPRQYPADLTVQSANGVAMEAVLLGRGPTKIHALRKSDDRHFALNLGQLSAESQQKVGRFPESMTDEEVAHAVEAATPKKAPALATFLEDQIKDKTERLGKKTTELANPKLTTAQKQILQHDIKVLETEIFKLQQDLETKSR
ncbi:MAG: hypothetical protein R3F31_16210 [Verrucomicrobiales bacterium]|nr:hypothetical protein [Verrucomicrobiae bacterium]MCP5552068.1 hypothetical protein [Akkermansiaceae bacterium]